MDNTRAQLGQMSDLLAHVQARPATPEPFAEADNDFALAMYERLRHLSGNLFFSPFSIRAALCMTLAGARGETAAQMREALRISVSDEALHAAFGEVIHRLNTAGGGKYEMAVANSLWGQEDGAFQAEFLDLIARYYGGGLSHADFRQAAEAARLKINAWVEDKTKQKISDLIPPGGVDADTRLVLVNAIYFKGNWVLPFDKWATWAEPFYLEGGGEAQVALMHQKESFRYVQAEGFQAVELAYQGRDLAMLVLLPDKKDGLAGLEQKLSVRMLHDCVTQMRVCEVKLFLPRFKITWGTVDVGEQLAALGMPLAFKRFEADFSGINGYEPPHEESFFISAVFHKAFVDVTEEGTEAAAATAVFMALAGCAEPREPPPVPIFRADHPFLFAIREQRSGAILFLGRVTDPPREDEIALPPPALPDEHGRIPLPPRTRYRQS